MSAGSAGSELLGVPRALSIYTRAYPRHLFSDFAEYPSITMLKFAALLLACAALAAGNNVCQTQVQSCLDANEALLAKEYEESLRGPIFMPLVHSMCPDREAVHEDLSSIAEQDWLSEGQKSVARTIKACFAKFD